MFPTPPEDYDPEEAASLLARYPDQDIPADRRVNVVGVMLEAFCDLTDFPALAEQPPSRRSMPRSTAWRSSPSPATC